MLVAVSPFSPGIIHAEPGIAYQVRMEGMRDRELRRLLESVSSTMARRNIPAASLNLFRRRAERDIPNLVNALKSQGYFGACVTVEVDAGV